MQSVLYEPSPPALRAAAMILGDVISRILAALAPTPEHLGEMYLAVRGWVLRGRGARAALSRVAAEVTSPRDSRRRRIGYVATSYVDSADLDAMPSRPDARAEILEALTPEERRIATALEAGHSHQAIAAPLGCSAATVGRKVQLIREKLSDAI